MIRRRMGGIAVSVAVAPVLLVGGTAVSAQAAESDCASEGFYACIWRDSSFKTNSINKGLIGFNYYIPKFGTWNYKTTTLSGHDSASSAKSTASKVKVRFYKDENYGGSHFVLAPGAKDADFGNGTPAGSFNDELDSGIFEDEM